MAEKLQTERQVFEAHINEWRAARIGKFVLIKDNNVIGFFDSLEVAFRDGSNRFGLEDFFIEQILPSQSVNVSFVWRTA